MVTRLINHDNINIIKHNNDNAEQWPKPRWWMEWFQGGPPSFTGCFRFAKLATSTISLLVTVLLTNESLRASHLAWLVMAGDCRQWWSIVMATDGQWWLMLNDDWSLWIAYPMWCLPVGGWLRFAIYQAITDSYPSELVVTLVLRRKNWYLPD